MRNKKFEIILIMCFCMFVYTSFISSENPRMSFQELKSLLKELKQTCDVKYDNINQVVWVSSKKEVDMNNSKSKVYFGFTETKELYQKRLRIEYNAPSWLFVDKLFLSVGSRRKDNQRIYEIPIDQKYLKKEVLSGGDIKEVIDIPFNSKIEGFFEDILSTENNETMTIRFSGKDKYYDSYLFSNKYKKMSKPVFECYDSLEKRFSE